jgi:hypothetical protein
MYKIVNNMVPSCLSRKFTPTSMIHEHNLRGSNHKLFVPRSLTESLKKRLITYRGATLWNDQSRKPGSFTCVRAPRRAEVKKTLACEVVERHTRRTR